MEKLLYINGLWQPAESGEWFDVDNPATEEVIARVPRGDASDVAQAVHAAKRAFESWRWTPANARAEMLHEVAHKVREHFDELVTLLIEEEGKPRAENAEEMEWVATTFDYYAELGRNVRGRVIPSNERSQFNFVLKEPYGVVGCIVPWNFPLLLLAWKMAPALAAGNTVVIKPSEMTPLATLRFVELCCDHLPAGVVNVVTGYGDAGQALVQHPDVPVIAFTGSVATGQKIATVAAPMMKHLHLELGGKDAFVVGPDADLDSAVKALTYAALINAGQVCTSSERVYVPDHLRDQFAESVADFVKNLKLGDGRETDTDIGPMIGAEYREKVANHVEQARQGGARVLVGGKIPERRGYFYEPAVLVNVDHSMPIMTEETFGPAIPIMSYDSFDEAIHLVNDSKYGLGATLRSNDPKLIKRFFEEIKAGTIWINDPLTDNYAGPFGGMKMTGGGRELGEEGLLTFMETKHVHWDFSEEPKAWWYPYGRGE
jgi:acyl-CoA reductase-like NAD-dependent aldehyde dehydrogenase